MSHFSVLIIGINPEDQLAPFNEQPGEGSEFLKWNDMEKEWRAEWETKIVDRVQTPDGQHYWPWDDRFRKEDALGIGSDTHEVPADHKKIKMPMKELYPSFDEFCEKYCNCEKDPAHGYGYWHNPDAKWDWHQLGGRWQGTLKLSPGGFGKSGDPGMMEEETRPGYCDQSLKGDIDWAYMNAEELTRAKQSWEKAHEEIRQARENNDPDNDVEKATASIMWLYGMEQDDTEESFIERSGHFSTFAILKDGKWHERGNMGSWGMVSNERSGEEWKGSFKELFADVSDDTLISIYDCHT